MKKCSKCNKEKPLEDYSLTPANNPRGACKACRSIDNKGVEARSRKLRFKYGITHEDYLKLLHKQQGKCAVCFAKASDQYHGCLDVDHNHNTGEVRGLLCNNCNRLLGFAGDSSEVLQNASDYLKEKGSYCG